MGRVQAASNRDDGSTRVQRRLTRLLRSGRLPALLVMVGGFVLLYGFLFSGDFLVASVVVKGTDIGDPAQVVTTADAIGEPIFTIDASESAERVAALPYVESVTVRTRYPDEVVISVVERTPVVLWQVGSRAFLVDAHGNVLAEQVRDGLPLVIAEEEPPVVGDTIDAERVAAIIAVRETLADRLEDLRWVPDDGLVARLTDKRIIILGSADRLPLKLAVYGEVARLTEPWSLLDLREPDRPFYE
jgi:cell division protein FtsQ